MWVWGETAELSPCSICTAETARGGISGPPRDRARCKHGPRISIHACHLFLHPGVHAAEPGTQHHAACSAAAARALLHREDQPSHAGLPHKNVCNFGVLQHVCKGKEERGGGGESPNPAPKLLLCFTVHRAADAGRAALPSLAPAAGGTLPAPRPPSVCLSLCPFCLLAVSSGWTISSKLMVTALGSALKSMVPIRARPGHRCPRGAAAAASGPCLFSTLGKASVLPPRAAAPAGWPGQLHHEFSAKADPNEEVTSHL